MVVTAENAFPDGEQDLVDLRADVCRFLSDPAVRNNPASLYGRLVRDAPLLDLGSMWLVSGFDELSWLSGRQELQSFSSARERAFPLTRIPGLATLFALMLPMRDGADHRRLKTLAKAAFSPERITRLDRLIQDAIEAILSRAIAQGGMDIVSDLALPLPLVISAAMLDIPVTDRPRVHKWALLVQRQFLRYDQDRTEVVAIETQVHDLALFVQSLCDSRRRRPGEDLISDLVAAADADELSTDELTAFILLLFVNGLETLTGGLTVAIWELLRRPEERIAIVADRNYAEAVFDESIRLNTPVRFSARTLNADVVFYPHRLREGDVIALWYAAANRDPRQFSDPDRFNPMRERRHHLGFGHGVHHCLGAALSLAVGSRVLQHLAKLGDRLTTEVTPETVSWSPSLAITTVESLPVRIAP